MKLFSVLILSSVSGRVDILPQPSGVSSPFRGAALGRKSVYPPPATVLWLRDYFQEKEPEPVSPYRFYKYMLSRAQEYREDAERYREAVMRAVTPGERARALFNFRYALREAKRWEAVSYDSIRKVFYLLRKLGLIEFIREEPPIRGGHNRRCYKIVESKKGLFQTGLQRVLWPWTYYGERHYRAAKRARRTPPKKELV